MINWMREKDVFLKLFSLALSVLLWFYVMSVTNPDVSQQFGKVPVTFTGMQSLTNRELMITYGLTSTVSLKIEGKSDKVSLVNDNNISVIADLSHITAPGTYDVIFSVTVGVSDIALTKETEVIKITVDKAVSKTVPVKLYLTGDMAPGYAYSDPVLTPDYVKISGPEGIVSKIAAARINYDIDEIKAAIDVTAGYEFVDKSGNIITSNLLESDVQVVHILIGVQQISDLKLAADVIPTGFITAEQIKLSFTPEHIRVEGSPSALSGLTGLKLEAVDLSQLIKEDRMSVQRSITLPEGVTSVDGITEVTATAEFVGLERRTVHIPENQLPESDWYTYSTGLTFTVLVETGNTDTLDSEAFEVAVLSDPGTLEAGTHDLPVTIAPVSDRVIVIGTHTIPVEVME